MVFWYSFKKIFSFVRQNGTCKSSLQIKGHSLISSRWLSSKNEIDLKVQNNDNVSDSFDKVIAKMGNIANLDYVNEQVEGALSFRVKSNDYFIPVGGAIDVEAEIAKLEEELKYTEGFLNSVNKKLSNERFVNNAPEKVVAIEKAKQADAEAKIEALKTSLASLK